MRARLGILGIVLFVALDAMLVLFAFRHVQAPPPSPSQTPSDAPHADRSHGPEVPANEGAGSAGEPTHMSVADDGSYIRATAGSCRRDRPPQIEISRSGGRDFDGTDVEGVTEVLRVAAVDSDNLSLVGTDATCTPDLYVTEDGGSTWTSRKNGADSLWFAAPDESAPRAVHAPGGLTKTPCKPLRVSAVASDVLRILCVSGQVIGTADVGANWVTLGNLPRATDVHFPSPSEGYAVATRRSCSAAVLGTVDGGYSWSRLSCLEGGIPRAIAAKGDNLGVQVGGRLNISTDGGVSWAAP